MAELGAERQKQARGSFSIMGSRALVSPLIAVQLVTPELDYQDGLSVHRPMEVNGNRIRAAKGPLGD